MGLITEKVMTKWVPKTKKYYESKGYIFTKWKDSFEIKVEDLLDYSEVRIQAKCDGCNKILNIGWNSYKDHVKEDGKCYCVKCSHQLYATEHTRLTKLKNGTSFYDWCMQNNHDDWLKLWDYELNSCIPKDINYATNIAYWFKCIKCSEHKSELKHIGEFTCKNKNRNIECIQCNSIGQWLLDNYGKDGIKIYWSDKNTINPFKIAHGTPKKYWFKCPECGYEKLVQISNFTRIGIGCNKCGDGISFPNKIMFNMLDQFNINFVSEYSPKWIGRKRYDFYFKLNNKQYIIEMDGGIGHGHKIYANSKITVEESKDIDDYKDRLAREHGIDVIRIDCQISELDYIKNNILNSKLNDLFDLSIIDWNECQKYALSNLVKQACNYWNDGIKDITEISKLIKVHKVTITNYLKQGSKLKWCDYDHLSAKKVYCIELNKVYASSTKAEEELGINKSISSCCHGKLKTAGKSVIGEPLHWMFYNEYVSTGVNDEIYKDNCIKKTVCTTTNEIFISMTDAHNKYHTDISDISKCCNGKKNFAGKHPITGEKLQWMYYKDYLKEN